jgi:hypothetical protein
VTSSGFHSSIGVSTTPPSKLTTSKYLAISILRFLGCQPSAWHLSPEERSRPAILDIL